LASKLLTKVSINITIAFTITCPLGRRSRSDKKHKPVAEATNKNSTIKQNLRTRPSVLGTLDQAETQKTKTKTTSKEACRTANRKRLHTLPVADKITETIETIEETTGMFETRVLRAPTTEMRNQVQS
jgi:hypothetical protein